MATAVIPRIPTFAIPYLSDCGGGEPSVLQGISPNVDGSGLKVLVAEDSPFSRKLIEQALFGQPYSLIFAATGREAVDMYVRHRPSLVIMDWMMPDLNGLEICRRLRSISFDCYTHIIMLPAKKHKARVLYDLQTHADHSAPTPYTH